VKRLSAILLSLLLVWMQAVVGAQTPVSGVTPATCTCCDCGRTDCCVTSSSPDSAPAPAAPVRAGVQIELSILAPTSVAWTLPATEPHILSLSASSPLTAMGVPLFTRDCALLI
jgi:hypothetical protein